MAIGSEGAIGVVIDGKPFIPVNGLRPRCSLPPAPRLPRRYVRLRLCQRKVL
jgi:hypothetical protein